MYKKIVCFYFLILIFTNKSDPDVGLKNTLYGSPGSSYFSENNYKPKISDNYLPPFLERPTYSHGLTTDHNYHVITTPESTSFTQHSDSPVNIPSKNPNIPPLYQQSTNNDQSHTLNNNQQFFPINHQMDSFFNVNIDNSLNGYKYIPPEVTTKFSTSTSATITTTTEPFPIQFDYNNEIFPGNTSGYIYQSPPKFPEIPNDLPFIPSTISLPMDHISNNNYLPPQTTIGKSGSRNLKDSFKFKQNSGSKPIQLQLQELRCLSGSNGYFRSIINIQSPLENPPVIDNQIVDSTNDCTVKIIQSQIYININGNQFKKCQVINCTNHDLCLRLRFPQIYGMQTLTDSILTLQCKVQERVVSRTHLLHTGIIDNGKNARSSGSYAQGGSQQPFRNNVGLYTQRSTGFSKQIEPGGTVNLGEEVLLRVQTNTDDGWNHTRLADVNLQRLTPTGELINSVVLINTHGCVNQLMKSICPLPPIFEKPLGYSLSFRAVMFQGMRNGDEMILSVKIIGCIDFNDCSMIQSDCGRNDVNRRRRRRRRHIQSSSEKLKLTEISKISFRVQMNDLIDTEKQLSEQQRGKKRYVSTQQPTGDSLNNENIIVLICLIAIICFICLITIIGLCINAKFKLHA